MRDDNGNATGNAILHKMAAYSKLIKKSERRILTTIHWYRMPFFEEIRYYSNFAVIFLHP